MKLNENLMIIGENVVFVPYKENHVLKYHEWMKNPDLLEATASKPLSIEDEYKMQQSWRLDDDKCTFIILSKKVLFNSTDFSDEIDENVELQAMVGDVNLFFNEEDNKKLAEIEIMIAEKSFRNQGLGKEAVQIMLFYGYDQLHCNEFVAKISDNNVQSLRLFKKLEFEDFSYSSVFKESTLKLQCGEMFMNSIIHAMKNKIEFRKYKKEGLLI